MTDIILREDYFLLTGQLVIEYVLKTRLAAYPTICLLKMLLDSYPTCLSTDL